MMLSCSADPYEVSQAACKQQGARELAGCVSWCVALAQSSWVWAANGDWPPPTSKAPTAAGQGALHKALLKRGGQQIWGINATMCNEWHSATPCFLRLLSCVLALGLCRRNCRPISQGGMGRGMDTCCGVLQHLLSSLKFELAFEGNWAWGQTVTVKSSVGINQKAKHRSVRSSTTMHCRYMPSFCRAARA